MTGRWQRRRSAVRIEITALIDVVLLLLIFFMVSARLVPEFGFVLNLPVAGDAGVLEERESTLSVQVDAEDNYFLNGRPVRDEHLAEQLSTAEAVDIVIVEADQDASHGGVTRVFDLARRAGIDSVQVAARQARGQEEHGSG